MVGWLVHSLLGLLVGWFVGWFVGCLLACLLGYYIDWLAASIVGFMINLLVACLLAWLIGTYFGCLLVWLADWLISYLIIWLVVWLVVYFLNYFKIQSLLSVLFTSHFSIFTDYLNLKIYPENTNILKWKFWKTMFAQTFKKKININKCNHICKWKSTHKIYIHTLMRVDKHMNIHYYN